MGAVVGGACCRWAGCKVGLVVGGAGCGWGWL